MTGRLTSLWRRRPRRISSRLRCVVLPHLSQFVSMLVTGLLLATLLTTLSGCLSPKGVLTLFLTLNVTNVDHRNWCGVACALCGALCAPEWVRFVVYLDFTRQLVTMVNEWRQRCRSGQQHHTDLDSRPKRHQAWLLYLL